MHLAETGVKVPMHQAKCARRPNQVWESLSVVQLLYTARRLWKWKQSIFLPIIDRLKTKEKFGLRARLLHKKRIAKEENFASRNRHDAPNKSGAGINWANDCSLILNKNRVNWPMMQSARKIGSSWWDKAQIESESDLLSLLLGLNVAKLCSANYITNDSLKQHPIVHHNHKRWASQMMPRF